MQGSAFDEIVWFRNICESRARALLIGRRALVIMGLPVLTADYDFWIHNDDIAAFNAAALPVGLVPTHSPMEARTRGRYVLENDEHVDVLVARSVPTSDGQKVAFEEIWPRRQPIDFSGGVTMAIPCLDDLIATKRFGARPKDLEDIRLLETLRTRQKP